ncbi:DUF4384 domain-containing protein [Scytonema sp. UIC 10036]|uniref:DUF4384 domain-containing protein n=1 Tax=Scytonema sp. UIC 10036 TaxID=2304196 RepID=UPI001FAA152C|nr:DUF4384 domain-containing protein [Scytonema sp. UIC 10036]
MTFDLFDSNTTAQAKQGLQALKRVTPLPLGQQEVQYIFGRMTPERNQRLQQLNIPNLPVVGSLGLFFPSLDQIIPKSFGDANETVAQAVERLTSKFKSLLAARIIKQMVGNTNTSRLKVTASMNIAESQKIISQAFTVRGRANSKQPARPVTITGNDIPKLPLETQVAFQIENQEPVDLYVSIFVIDAEGEIATIFPDNQLISLSEEAALIRAWEKRIIPDDEEEDAFTLNINEPLGITEALIIASTSPLSESIKALQKIVKRRGATKRSAIPVTDEFLDMADKLLQDLDTATRQLKY